MQEMLNQFGINLWTLIAQIVNFSIIVFVLHRFIYKPILKILDERKDRIENSIKQAEVLEHRTQKLEEELKEKFKEAENKADTLISEAKQIAEKTRIQLVEQANQEVTSMIEKAKKDIEHDQAQMMQEVKSYIVDTSMIITQKILQDKLDESVQKKLIEETLHDIPTQK